jgi:hypothetical protein
LGPMNFLLIWTRCSLAMTPFSIFPRHGRYDAENKNEMLIREIIPA